MFEYDIKTSSRGYATCSGCDFRIPPDGELPFTLRQPELGESDIMIGARRILGPEYANHLIKVMEGPLTRGMLDHHKDPGDNESFDGLRHKGFSVIDPEGNKRLGVFVNVHFAGRAAVTFEGELAKKTYDRSLPEVPPEKMEWFLGLSTSDQLDYLDDLENPFDPDNIEW